MSIQRDVLVQMAGDLPKISPKISSKILRYIAAIFATGFLLLADTIVEVAKPKRAAKEDKE